MFPVWTHYYLGVLQLTLEGNVLPVQELFQKQRPRPLVQVSVAPGLADGVWPEATCWTVPDTSSAVAPLFLALTKSIGDGSVKSDLPPESNGAVWDVLVWTVLELVPHPN